MASIRDTLEPLFLAQYEYVKALHGFSDNVFFSVETDVYNDEGYDDNVYFYLKISDKEYRDSDWQFFKMSLTGTLVYDCNVETEVDAELYKRFQTLAAELQKDDLMFIPFGHLGLRSRH